MVKFLSFIPKEFWVLVDSRQLKSYLFPLCLFGYSLSALFGYLILTKHLDTSLSLPMRVLLAGNQFKLPVRTAFIPASRIEDHSLPWGICFHSQHLLDETWYISLYRTRTRYTVVMVHKRFSQRDLAVPC